MLLKVSRSTDYFHLILEGDHTRSRIISHSKVGALSKFITKKASCVGCKVPIANQSEALCNHCKVSFIIGCSYAKKESTHTI